MKKHVSIIILNYNNAKVTKECVNAILQNTKHQNVEILIVDNGSKKFERESLKMAFKNSDGFTIKFVQNYKNLGYGKANNRAVKKASGDILVFLNNDVLVTRDWLTPLISFLQKNPTVAACQPKIKSNMEKDFFDYAGGAGGFLDIFGYPFTRGRVFNSIEKDNGQYDKPCEIVWASGSCLIIKRELFQLVGGFDEYFFAYMEEVDLCVRLIQKKYKIYCVPKSVVFHYGAYTSNKKLTEKIFFNHKNNLYFVLKHYPLFPYLPLILIRILFDVASLFYYVFETKPEFALSLLKTYRQMFLDLRFLFSKRIIRFFGDGLWNIDIIYKGSLVIDYFILKKRNFDAIFFKTRESTLRYYKNYLDITHFSE